ncbi:hypothetical protein [Nocardia sp. NPDC004711]
MSTDAKKVGNKWSEHTLEPLVALIGPPHGSSEDHRTEIISTAIHIELPMVGL